MGKRRPLRKFLNVNIREKRINPKLRNYRMSAPEETVSTIPRVRPPISAGHMAGNNGPSADASGRSRQRTMPRHARCGGAGKRSGAPGAAILLFSFGPFACGKDRNRLHARATRSGPQGSGVLADAPTANANARPNGPKEKIRDRFNPRRHEHERQHQAFRR